MFILLNFLLMDVKFEPTNLENLTGKWTVGARMSSLLVFTEYSILWKPWETVMIGIDGSGSVSPGSGSKKTVVRRRRRRRRIDDSYDSDYNYDKWSGSVSIGLYKYFRANSSLLPFITLLPNFSMDYSYYESGEYWHESSTQTYSGSLGFGLEYFFTLWDKQLSLKLKTSLVEVSRAYTENKYSDEEDTSYVSDSVYFHLPTKGSLSTWVCLHF